MMGFVGTLILLPLALVGVVVGLVRFGGHAVGRSTPPDSAGSPTGNLTL